MLFDLPLYVLPVLPGKQRGTLSTISISYRDSSMHAWMEETGMIGPNKTNVVYPKVNETLAVLWFGQYNLGWNGKFDDWTPAFTSPEADAFHNSLGVEFSVAHQMDLKDPGNTYKPKAKIGIEVFHCFNSLAGAQELGKAFNPESPFFVDEPRYVGPYDATIWKIMDDIDYTA